MSHNIEQRYALAKEQFAEMGVDVEAACRTLASISLSLHCWQGDDVIGFENLEATVSGGILATGNYPGKARTPDELRGDIEVVLHLLPGKHRLNLHAMYAETGEKRVDRDALEPSHFSNWIAWAKSNGLGLDFNPTYFSHPLAAKATLSSGDEGIRNFWVRHGQACRRIGEAMGRELGKTCITNIWIPDSSKDLPVDRKGPRERLIRSLDQIFAERIDLSLNKDSLESKLFGIGGESYTVGSHELYMGYGISRNKMICLDMGHFHPTESVADKLSSILLFQPEVLLHISRGVRWDSDHVVILNDDLRSLTEEIVRGNFLNRVHIALDFFDASINRVVAWVTGSRATLKAFLIALLEPTAQLRECEANGDYTSRLALMEEVKALPFGAVWDYYCEKEGVPSGKAWIADVRDYEIKIAPSRR